MDFWERLKIEIKQKKTTQEWVAKTANIPFSTLQRWLSNRTMPNADQALAIARALEVDLEWLIDGTISQADEFWVPNHLKPLLLDAKKLPMEKVATAHAMIRVLLAEVETARGLPFSQGA